MVDLVRVDVEVLVPVDQGEPLVVSLDPDVAYFTPAAGLLARGDGHLLIQLQAGDVVPDEVADVVVHVSPTISA